MPHELLTLAEQSGFTRTGRSDEVARLCAAFAARWPQTAQAFVFGRSSEGRDLWALLVTRCTARTPRALKQAGVPLLLLQAGIHPGESDGKDAGFIVLRELLQGTEAGALDRQAILFVPAFNVDGHERTGRWNRPNQNGPQETGWRTTARNLNLNRDYCKADAPEMQALLRLVTEWDPLLCVDLHVTDGADFQPDISLQVEPLNQGDPGLHASAQALRDGVMAHLVSAGSMPLPFYPDFFHTDDPASGFVLTVFSPRFSTGYFPQRNRFTLLVETHSWKPYATRIQVTRQCILGVIQELDREGSRWLQQAQRADRAALDLPGTDLVMDYRSSWREPTGSAERAPQAMETARMIDFPGYAYRRTRSPITGEPVTAYDPSVPQIWRVPYRDRVEPSLTVRLPQGGYIIPAAYAEEFGPRVRIHGICIERSNCAIQEMPVEGFRASSVRFGSQPFEGRMRAQLEGQWLPMRQRFAAGALYVPLAQPLARLLAALLEPQAPDSFAAWGFFNACFEQKEHLEPYVAEAIAAEMYGDATVRTQFEEWRKQHPAAATEPAARLEFFLRRHASWDQRYNLYPVFRVASTPTGFEA
jgi:hypothetical protein